MQTYDHTVAVAISTAPYQNLVEFGLELGLFRQENPEADFVWEEAVYADGLDEDDDGNVLVADNITIFERDTDRAVFLVTFRTEADRDLFRLFRATRLDPASSH